MTYKNNNISLIKIDLLNNQNYLHSLLEENKITIINIQFNI